MIGRQLSHYVILEELHRGESQIVYRARDEKLNREVALKVLPPDLVQDRERRGRFIAEAKASASLEHPHIAVIHEIDESDGFVLIAMELLRGSSLAERLAEGPLPLLEALDVGIGVAAGLAYAHERGIVHRDVKPANVMLTAGGHPKLIDFGLAKLLDAEQSPFLGHAGLDEPPLQSTTREGVIAGTVSFMSPEQARGGRVDPRSDVFSFGLLLQTALTARAPFEGASRIDTLHAILHEPAPRLGGILSDARDLIQPILDGCLQKDPDRRYPSMAQVLEDLKRVRLRLEVGAGLGRRLRTWLPAGALIVLGIALALFLPRPSPAPPVEEEPSLAILPFENLTGDPELDWLRTGIPDMLATDLSQSPELEVLGRERLAPILEEIGSAGSASLDPERLSEIAARAGARTVLFGDFSKGGDAIRISARLDDVRTGDVLFSERAEAEGEADLFSFVERVAGRVKARFDLRAPDDELDRDLREVTTASLEAYREYAEGIRLHERFREEEAVPHFQRAIELDPGFAMALAKLGVVMSNLGRHEEADEYAERALEHVDRLSERERLYIEGWYYSRNPDTLARAVEAYREAIELYPDHGSARHNLGNIYFATERYEEAIEQLEQLRSRRMSFPATYEQLAMAYKALGEIESARRVLAEYRRRNPDDPTTLLALARLEIETGNLQAGKRLLGEAEALGAHRVHAAPLRWEAHVLSEEWDLAFEAAGELAEDGGPVEELLGGRLLSLTSLYRGELDSVLSRIDRFVESQEDRRAYRSQPLLLKAKILLEIGRDRAAKEVALGIQGEDDRYKTGHLSLLLAAIASERLGESEQARTLARAYRETIDPALGPAPVRLRHFLEGELWMARGELSRAIRELEEAESMLSPRGADGVHAAIWYSLATAHRLAGNDGEAIGWYQRIVDSTEERIFEPIRYVRSFYFLAELQEKDGDRAEARRNYEEFLEHWGEGEIDRERVEEARAKLR